MNAEIISIDRGSPSQASPSDPDFDTEVRSVIVPPQMHGHRLDKCLAECIPEFSRSYLQQLLIQGDVSDSGRVASKASAKVQAGQCLTVNLRPTPQAQAFKAEPLEMDVVFEDDHVIVINKPAGLVVHPAAGNWTGTLLNGLLMHHAGASDLPRAGIVHRLDKDTSGLMMVGKTRAAVDGLSRQIAGRTVNRYYLALAEREWRRYGQLVSVDQPLGRDPANRIRMAVMRSDQTSGKPAKTLFRLLDGSPQTSLLGCKLFTGRTHQIRVHLAWLGHPIVGDSVYGGHTTALMQRQALHATRLDFLHPISGAHLSFSSALPADMQQTLVEEGLYYNWASLGPATFDPSAG